VFERVHATMERALQDRVFPAAVLLVADDGEPVLHQAYGEARLDTVFDLASLTKAVGTSLAAMWLVQRGRLDLDTPAARHLAGLRRPGADRIRIWHLLAHASGLPAWRPYYRTFSGAAVPHAAAREPLEAPAGERAVYSDLGFMLLGGIVSKIARRPLDALLRDEIYQPLGMRRTFFVQRGRRRGMSFAPTGRCAWRGRVLLGEVHDENAAAMGGVAGHAGLFSTAHDLHVLCRALADAWSGQSGPISRDVLRAFWRRREVLGSTWCLGWDAPSAHGSSAGRHFRRAVGHLGYTGCSLWMDPGRGLWVVLLTNRVALGREPNRLKPVRPRLHDRIWEALA
jgi:serine-type D-Ala-D-Ala carboxypeptidase